MARRSSGSDWTARRSGRGRRGLDVVDVAAMPRDVTAVAFDQYVFDDRGLARADGATVARGAHPDGSVIAVASVPWEEMPFEWTAIQSRRSADLLGLAGDEMEPVGHTVFDERFAVDSDDVSAFRRTVRTSLREWLVAFDDEHGPLVVVFDGAADDPDARDGSDPRRRKDDVPADTQPSSHATPTVVVARLVTDDADVVPTMKIATDLAERVRSSIPH